MSYELQCDIVAFEYTGYGDSNRSTTDLEMINDIESVYYFLIETLNYKWYEITAYGHSIGSGPSTFLSSNSYTPIMGLVLHAPISSGMRVIECEVKKTARRDLFPNVDMIKYTKTPVFVIHGIQDQDVGVENGQMIYNNCNNAFNPWWVKEGHHNDISSQFRSDYFSKLKHFLLYIEQIKIKYDKEELLEKYKAIDWDPKSSPLSAGIEFQELKKNPVNNNIHSDSIPKL